MLRMPPDASSPPRPETRTTPTGGRAPRIYLACPWGPWGGGMYKVADYLRQSETLVPGAPPFRIVNSRGPTLWGSPFVLLGAALRTVAGALSGDMALLHVNMAKGLSVARKSILIYCAAWMGKPSVLHLHAASSPFLRP